ncbi:MAG: hypothetical protein R3C02_10725 [Planctomycetaceae bacterium]
MPKVVAIDRTENYLRYVIADVGARGKVQVQAAESLAVDADAESVPNQLGEQLREGLTRHKATKAVVLFGVGRGAIETVDFTVPMAEEAELPGMVRNLAMRNLSSISDESPLDFLASAPKPDGSRNVIAMALREEVRRELNLLAGAAQIRSSRILVRPQELRAFTTAEESSSEVMLLVSRSDQMADVLLLHPQGTALSRSIRLPETSSSAKSAQLTVNEIRRTLFSLPVDDFDATQIDQILLLCGEGELPYLATELGTALDARVQRRDPFDIPGVTCQFEVTNRSQFAPLIGMLVNESLQQHPIDFLNPRKPPAPVNRRKTVLSAVAAAAMVIGGGWYYVNSQFAEVDDENARLNTRLRELKETVEKVEPKLALAKGLLSWERSRISWLDELRDLTLRMPSSRDLTVQRFSASASRDGGANVSFGGVAQAPEFVSEMEDDLRDKHHLPRTPGLRERQNGDQTVWTFQTSMSITARKPDEYIRHLPPSETQPTDTEPVQDEEISEVSETDETSDKP